MSKEYISRYIDSASVYEVVTALSYARPDQCDPWAWEGAIVTSCALATAGNINLSPSPGPYGGASGPYGTLMHALLQSKTVGLSNHDSIVTQAARNSTAKWAREQRYQIKTAFE